MDNINLQRIEGYTVQLVAEDVWAIDEFGADIIYLVKGEKSAAVIDTGSGFGNLKKVIETLTDLPYVVLNTHGHLDHVGGNHEFGKAYLSEKDFKMADTEKLRSGWKKYVEKTKKEPGFYGTEYIIEGREPGDFQMLPLSEHQIFDLGVKLLALRSRGNRSLVYVYREKQLAQNLNRPGVARFLEKYGYENTEPEQCLALLKKRFEASEDFPHEIGIFLDYPLGDVIGFIQNGGQNYKCSGCWKVYCNECEALKMFQKYHKCREVYRNLWAKGRSVLQLTVAA